MRLTLTQQTLCKLLAENLFKKASALDNTVDWEAVYKESRAQAVSLLAFQNFDALPLNDDLKVKIDSKLSKKALQNINIINQHKYLHQLMCGADIPYCVLKGVVSAHYYNDPLIRAMGDVDFYVDNKHISRVRDILVQEGFNIDDDTHMHHIVFSKGSMHFELHFKVAGIPDGDNGKLVEPLLEDLLASKIHICDEFVEYYAPSVFHHGLIMLLHVQGHLLSGGIGLRHLCDWAVFVGSMSSDDFCHLFKEKLVKIGLWKFAQTLSLASSLYIGLERADWMGNDVSLAEAIVNDIFIGGNFGKKSQQREYEGLMISNHGKNGVKHSRLRQGFDSINLIVCTRWPIVKKLPFLYPFGWIFSGVRYLFRVLFKKRKLIDLANVYKNSGNRKKLYEQLQLFETEK